MTRSPRGEDKRSAKVTALVLIAEDDLDISTSMSLTLRLDGHEVAQAFDGEQAMSMAQRLRPDLILLDVMMPVVSGYDVALKLRENRATADIPVIFVTARGEMDERARGLEIAADYICKPFATQELRQRVQNVLRTLELEQELERQIKHQTQREVDRQFE